MSHRHGPHDAPHRLAQLARPGPAVHRLGRRRFLTELGRNTFAVAILGGVVAACSDDEPAAEPAADPTEPPASAEPPATTELPAPSTTAAEQQAEEQPPEVLDGPLEWAQVSLGFVSAYVLVRGNDAAVVDTGNPGGADQIGATLATLGVTFDDVRHVVLTHHHPDHVGSLGDVVERSATPDVYAGAADIGSITSPVELIAVGDGDDVFGLQVIETPGHTPGSISLLDPGIGLLVAGDALLGNEDGTGVGGSPERFTADAEQAAASVAKLAGLDFDTLAVGHGQPVLTGADALVRGLAAG